MESLPRHSSKDRDVINRMLGSAAVKPLPPMTAAAVTPAKPAPAKPSHGKPATPAKAGQPRPGGGEPDFASMTPAEKVAWNLARWKRVLG